jgi:hypothetical protein
VVGLDEPADDGGFAERRLRLLHVRLSM